MFSIRLRLQNTGGYPNGSGVRSDDSLFTGSAWLTGARALDFCRVHGLPESTFVPFASTYCGKGDRVLDLPESIAREILSSTAQTEYVTVDPSDLLPGEIVTAGYYEGAAPWKPRQINTLAVGPVSLERALVIRQFAIARQRAERAESVNAELRRTIRSLESQIEDLRELIPPSEDED